MVQGDQVNHIIVDQSKCFGCRICEIICSFTKENEINPKLSRIRIEPKNERIVYYVCRKCDNPVCVEACPIHAITIENGKFTLTKQCIENCSLCIDACPYKAIVSIPEKTIDVCDLCGQCILFCPADALHIGERGGTHG